MIVRFLQSLTQEEIFYFSFGVSGIIGVILFIVQKVFVNNPSKDSPNQQSQDPLEGNRIPKKLYSECPLIQLCCQCKFVSNELAPTKQPSKTKR
jgi:hypothetical protein